MSHKKRYHFIAIGGAVMHQLALHLHDMGHIITGSDDAIYDPARSNLGKYGILPEQDGWFPEKIHDGLDAVILGMHAKGDNPELQRALEKRIKVFSFPEFVYEHSKDKKRVVVAGSHGKTTTTSMIMHVLRKAGMDFDYLVGAQIEGFDFVVRISDSAPVIVIEGDEYLTSPLDLRSKFLHYHPHLAIITGIAWDHINVFPVFEGYVDTFRQFMKSVADKIFYYAHDTELQALASESFAAEVIPYDSLPVRQDGEEVTIIHGDHQHAVSVFGAHNMANMSAALKVCTELGLTEEQFFSYIADFKGAAKRMELMLDDTDKKITVFRDFAHAPSKVRATVQAIRTKYPGRKMITALELHTFSSLQPDFIAQYTDSLQGSDVCSVYVDSEALKQKDRKPIDPKWLQEQFGDPTPFIPADVQDLKQWLNSHIQQNMVLLMMSSGHWGGLDIKKYCSEHF